MSRKKTIDPAATFQSVRGAAEITGLSRYFIIKGCQEKGLRVPEDLSVIGFDDSMPARLITPELTTIAQNIRGKAAEGVQMLMHALEDAAFRNDHKVLEVRLTERSSVGMTYGKE